MGIIIIQLWIQMLNVTFNVIFKLYVNKNLFILFYFWQESISGSCSGTNADTRPLDPNSTSRKMDKVYYQYREKLMNQGRFIDPETELEGDSFGMGVVRKEMDLTNDEKQYLLAVERGDVPSTRQYLSLGVQTGLNVNCVDPLGRSALLIAIENENIEMIEVLLNYNVEVGDSLLHAINEENVEAVELILNHEVATKGEEVRCISRVGEIF